MESTPRLSLFVFAVSFVLTVSTSFAGEGDTTSSTINFRGLEATLSSRIIHFRWEVESEKNGAYFLIEKSLDEENWTEVTKVASIKSHQEQHTYEVSEINFAEGMNEYFRVIRVDEFGQKSELDRINLNRPVLSNILLIPTPKKVNKEVVISYDSMIASRASFTIYSQHGDLILDKMIDISEGYNRILIDIKNYEAGNYSIVIVDEYENKITKRLTVYDGKR